MNGYYDQLVGGGASGGSNVTGNEVEKRRDLVSTINFYERKQQKHMINFVATDAKYRLDQRTRKKCQKHRHHES
jgi:hypothetical protein